MKKKENEEKRIVSENELLAHVSTHKIIVTNIQLKTSISMSVPAGGGYSYIAINNVGLSEAERFTALLHETGHCETGAFYNIHSPFDIIGKQEYRANKWAAEHALPKAALEQAAAEGYTEAWQLAEYFGVTEDFVRFAYMQYYGG